MALKKTQLFQDSERYGMFLVGRRNPVVFDAFLNLAHEIMHPKSAFDPLTKELLGAYVSKKFGCSFCYLGHLETAMAIGGEEVRSFVDRPTLEFSPIFELADKVIANQITEDDLELFLKLGYSEKHFEDVVLVCALFGFANRMVTGFGIEYNAQRDEKSSRYLAQGYRLPKKETIS